MRCFATVQDADAMARDNQTTLFGACFPAGTTAQSIKDAFLEETQTIPDQLEGPLAIFYSRMLSDKFPCPKVAPKSKRAPGKKAGT